LAQTLARRPVIVPSFFAASSTSCTWSRPWIVLLKFSLRVSVHFTGRPSVLDAKMTIASSG
jgi:hypothetical protein